MSNFQAAEQAMNTMWGHIESGELRRSVSVLKSLRLGREVTQFILNPDSYYFPNRRGNTFVTPESTPEDAIAVVQLQPNEKAQLTGRVTLHGLQKEALSQAGFSDKEVSKYKQKNGKDHFEAAGPDAVASVRTPIKALTGRLKKADAVLFRPTVIFNTLPGDEYTEHGADISMHEITHVGQVLARPNFSVKMRLQNELEAYSVQHQAVYSSEIPFSDSSALARNVERFRIRELGYKAFEPTPEFEHKLRQDPELRRIIGS